MDRKLGLLRFREGWGREEDEGEEMVIDGGVAPGHLDGHLYLEQLLGEYAEAAAYLDVPEHDKARAPELAPYEYTAAVEYLHKAREVGGYARYHEAIEFGKKARDYSREAVKLSRERGARAE